jgi:hypothetical protein
MTTQGPPPKDQRGDDHAGLARALAAAGLRSLHVEASPRGASVTLDVDGPDLVSSCTCGAPMPCGHARAALEVLGLGGELLPPLDVDGRLSEPVPTPRDARAASASLCRAAVASGLDPAAPALTEAMAALAQSLGVDPRPDARRAYARLVDALEHGRVRKAAGSLVELASIASTVGEAERRSEVSLLEVGRDTGTDPLGRWDETIFCDLARGELLLEGAPVVPGREAQISIGPYPRLVFGQLVDIEPGRAPRRVRLIQYEPRGQPTKDDVDRLVGHAQADLDAVRAAGADGTALVLARAARLGTLSGAAALVDDRGRAIALAEGARALTAALVRLAQGGTLRAVLGRIGITDDAQLQIRPLAAVVDHRLVRLA